MSHTLAQGRGAALPLFRRKPMIAVGDPRKQLQPIGPTTQTTRIPRNAEGEPTPKPRQRRATPELIRCNPATPATVDHMRLVPHSPTKGVYPASDDYVHAMEVHDPQRFLFVAGTMGLRPGGEPGTSLDEQLTLIWNNIRTILADADMTVANIVRLTSYIRDAEYAEANAEARVEALEGRAVPTTVLVAQTADPNWLVEVEVIAAA